MFELSRRELLRDDRSLSSYGYLRHGDIRGFFFEPVLELCCGVLLFSNINDRLLELPTRKILFWISGYCVFKLSWW